MTGRVPPHNIDAERGLVGLLLLDGAEDAIAAALTVAAADDFHHPAHSHIFAAVAALHARRQPSDPVTVADELRRTGHLELVGGPSALVGMLAGAPPRSSARKYAEIVHDAATRRRMIRLGEEVVELGYTSTGDPAVDI